ncbi:ABC transporter ATP-binding protein [Christensenellaceae bacterium NSJ-44]|uniref:ABC transporter ATP-binding protein n=1 Tax=Luoshenia tenuis TaxID=2763654 RepID=A0A926CYB0_9FIRM|nr:ABC transporter ATP-binding protein [Luoshenia tenuis]MBC8527922.1 ABC transporter ATP-binding protein [Luoshenia tenuis]SCJ40870.1 Daunorubicin/doxorubicin resistance ATP-binding protein DrrA [uncultured Clostridium sp.]
MALVEVQNLVKRYGELLALDHFNLNIQEGEIFGLLGPNGSGKTTAINCILALLKFDKGDIRLFGKPMAPNAYDIKRNIGVVMQNVAVFEELTVYENVDYFCALYVPERDKRRQLVQEAIDFVGLQDFCKFYPRKLSGGLLRRLNIACGIAHKPRLIFLDEPTVAVDPQSRNNILEGIAQLNREGATIVYTSHYMEEVEQLCTRIAIMDKGRTLATGTKEELKAMINRGETVRIDLEGQPGEIVAKLRELPAVASAKLEDHRLVVRCKAGGQHNLVAILDALRQWDVAFGRVFSELPTLNDVFLEITGKELRD